MTTAQAIGKGEKSSAWDFFYALDMAVACFVSYWVTTHVLSPFVAEPDALLATLAWGRGEPDGLAQARRRAGVTWPCVVGFVAGCAAGAGLEIYCGLWALALPVVLAAAAVALGELWTDGLVDAARRTATAGGHGATARTPNPP